MQQTVIPQLRVTQVERSKAFYLQGLGFKIDWEHRFGPAYPSFMQITRAGQSLFLTEHASDCQPVGAVYFIVPDADALLARFIADGIKPTNDIADTPWGTREFVLTDPDGNRLRFAMHPDQGKDK